MYVSALSRIKGIQKQQLIKVAVFRYPSGDKIC